MEVDSVTRQLDAAKETKGVGELLPNIVSRTMKEVFREEGSRIICGYFEDKAKLKLEEIVEKSEEFTYSLERLLGSGAHVIEQMILKNLYLELGMEYKEKEDYKFSDYVRELDRCIFVKG